MYIYIYPPRSGNLASRNPFSTHDVLRGVAEIRGDHCVLSGLHAKFCGGAADYCGENEPTWNT